MKDLAAWDAALRERKFLKPASFEAWWTPVRLASGTSYQYGFGWDVAEQRGERLIEHGGSWQGFRAAIARYVDQGVTVVVLANLASAEPETMAHEIAGLVEPKLRLPDAGGDARRSRSGAGREAARRARGLGRQPDRAGHGARDSPRPRPAARARRTAGARPAATLAALAAFRFLGEDDLNAKPLSWRGESVTRIVHYALDAKDARYAYRFYLTKDGRVADFGAEER